MTTHDGTYTCSHDPCDCRVADDETHVKDDSGGIYCSEDCRDGNGCDHPDCGCAQQQDA